MRFLAYPGDGTVRVSHRMADGPHVAYLPLSAISNADGDGAPAFSSTLYAECPVEGCQHRTWAFMGDSREVQLLYAAVLHARGQAASLADGIGQVRAVIEAHGHQPCISVRENLHPDGVARPHLR